MINIGSKAVKAMIYYNDEELQDRVDSFRFELSEESDDELVLDISEVARTAPDLPQYQPKAEIKFVFGFIGTNIVSKPMKMYVEDVKWRFTGERLKGTVYLTEKAVVLKKNTSRKVWNSASILNVMDQLATNNGLTPELQIFDKAFESNDQKIIKETFGEDIYKYIITKFQKTNFDISGRTIATFDTTKIKEVYKNQAPTWIKMERELGPNPTPQQVSSYLKKQNGLKLDGIDFTQYKSLPQGNKTDKQFLTELAQREAGGPYIVDTHEDKITLKKRNFNQEPYRSYEYGGPEGDCLEFTPMSNNRVKEAPSDNIGFMGWDKSGKNFYVGNTNILNDPRFKTLTKWRAVHKALKQREPMGVYDRIFAGAPVRVSGSVDVKGQPANGDNTNVVTNLASYRVITNKEAAEKLGAILETYAKAISDSANNPEEARAYADNMRARAELEKNPASARLELDPKIMVGMLLTFTGVSKKYSGNYYVVKVVHVVQPGSYAYTEVELVTTGSNIKEADNFLPAEALRPNVNKAIGPKRNKVPSSNKVRQR